MSDVRDFITKEIKERGLKQSFVAEKAGMTKQQLSDVVKKRRKLDANEFLKLCEVLEIMPGDAMESTCKTA